MLNLIKAQLFQVRSSKGYKVLIGIIVFLVLNFAANSQFNSDFQLRLMSLTHNDVHHGFFILSAHISDHFLGYLWSFFGLSIILILGMIGLISQQVLSTYESRTIQHFITYGHSRTSIYLSTLMTLFISIGFVAIALVTLGLIVWGVLFHPQPLTSGELLFGVKAIITWLLIIGATISTYTLFATLVPNKTLFSTVSTLLVTLAPMYMHELLGESVRSMLPLYILREFCGNPNGQIPFMALGIQALLIVAITSSIGCYVLNKKELK